MNRAYNIESQPSLKKRGVSLCRVFALDHLKHNKTYKVNAPIVPPAITTNHGGSLQYINAPNANITPIKSFVPDTPPTNTG